MGSSSYLSQRSSEAGSDSLCSRSDASSWRGSQAMSSAYSGSQTAREYASKRAPDEPRKRYAGSDASSMADSRFSSSTRGGSSYASSGNSDDASSICSQGSFSMAGFSYGQRRAKV